MMTSQRHSTVDSLWRFKSQSNLNEAAERVLRRAADYVYAQAVEAFKGGSLTPFDSRVVATDIMDGLRRELTPWAL
jgi:hypothetical protein